MLRGLPGLSTFPDEQNTHFRLKTSVLKSVKIILHNKAKIQKRGQNYKKMTKKNEQQNKNSRDGLTCCGMPVGSRSRHRTRMRCSFFSARNFSKSSGCSPCTQSSVVLRREKNKGCGRSEMTKSKSEKGVRIPHRWLSRLWHFARIHPTSTRHTEHTNTKHTNKTKKTTKSTQSTKRHTKTQNH